MAGENSDPQSFSTQQHGTVSLESGKTQGGKVAGFCQSLRQAEAPYDGLFRSHPFRYYTWGDSSRNNVSPIRCSTEGADRVCPNGQIFDRSDRYRLECQGGKSERRKDFFGIYLFTRGAKKSCRDRGVCSLPGHLPSPERCGKSGGQFCFYGQSDCGTTQEAPGRVSSDLLWPIKTITCPHPRRVGNAGGKISSTVLPAQSLLGQLSHARFAAASARE